MKIKIYQLILFLSFLIIWELLSDLNIIDSFIFSSPRLVLKTLLNLYNENNLFIHIFTTIYELIISFILGSIIGIFIASILWFNRTIAKIMEPFLTILNSLPKVALGPIIIIWFGADMNAIIIMSLLISVIITIINVLDGFNNTDKNKILLLKSFKANKFQIFYKLVFPSNLGTIFNAININISMSLVGIIMGEFLVSKKGIGYLIIYGSQLFNLNLVISGIFLLIILSIILFYSIKFIEKKLGINT